MTLNLIPKAESFLPKNRDTIPKLIAFLNTF